MSDEIKSPSLNDLYNFIENYHKLNEIDKEFFNKNNFDVVYAYIYNTNTQALNNLLSVANKGEPLPINKSPLSTFWLSGQKKINCDEPITDEIIDEVNKMNAKALCPYNSYEAASVAEHNKKYAKFRVLLENYKEYATHKYYEPNSEGYFKAKEDFELKI